MTVHFPMKGKHFCRFAIITALVLAPKASFAQPGGFSSDAVFDRLDEDGSGVIEPEEIENSRMRFMVDRMGIDTSRGITRDDYKEGAERMRQRFEEGGGFGGWGGFGDSSFRSRGDDDEDDDRGGGNREGRWARWGRDDGDESSRDRYSRGRDSRRGDRNSETTTAAKTEPPPRVTVDLPAEYVAGDVDRDGQIGLYEWTQWKSRALLGTFLGLDRDGDGFLTPRELLRAGDAKPVDVATLSPATPSGSTSAAASKSATSPNVAPATTAGSSAASLSTTDATAVIAAADQGQVKQAERLFSLLDSNHDGTISEPEWSASRRLKPRFEKAGANLAEPMSSELFVSYYVRIQAGDESI